MKRNSGLTALFVLYNYPSTAEIKSLHCSCNADFWFLFKHTESNQHIAVDCLSTFKMPSTPPTMNKTIRFPNDVIEQVEEAIQGKNCTFSAFVISAVRAALEELKEEE